MMLIIFLFIVFELHSKGKINFHKTNQREWQRFEVFYRFSYLTIFELSFLTILNAYGLITLTSFFPTTESAKWISQVNSLSHHIDCNLRTCILTQFEILKLAFWCEMVCHLFTIDHFTRFKHFKSNQKKTLKV